jgi:hypothetical protein
MRWATAGALLAALSLAGLLIWGDALLGRPNPEGTGGGSLGLDSEAIAPLGAAAVTLAEVREVCEREIVLRSDLPFTEFPRPGAPEYSEPAWDPNAEAWVWVVELVYEEGMALRREWECRITGEGRGLLRRNY